MPPKTARQLDRFSQFGLVAGQLALDDAGLRPGEGGAASPERIGIYLGSALGGIAYAEEQHERYMAKGSGQVAPNLALAVFGGAAPANLGIALDVRGPILSTANSCASGRRRDRRGARRDPGGRDRRGDRRRRRDPAEPAGVRGVRHHPRPVVRLERRPGHACRPFDARRDGFVMGEGATLLVLESDEVVRARGAEPYAEVMGYGATSDAYHMVQPRADGREAARAAADRAGRRPRVAPDEIDYVSAHASSTPIGDIAEARAIALALGPASPRECRSAGRRRCTGTRSGASGAIEAAICALAIRDGWAPGLGQPRRARPGRRGAAAGTAPRGPRRRRTAGSCRRRSASAA